MGILHEVTFGAPLSAGTIVFMRAWANLLYEMKKEAIPRG